MAKRSYKLFSELSTDLKKKILDIVKEELSQKKLQPIAAATAEQVRARTRSGKGSETGSKTFQLEPLAPSTIQSRKYSKKLSSKTKPSKSNLTHTGQMLDALYGEAEQNRITIKLDPSRDDGLDNRVIALLHETGTDSMPRRPFLGLSKTDLSLIERRLRLSLIERIKKIF